MKKITCGYCKKEIKKGSRMCSYCGKKFKKFEEQENKEAKLKKYFLITLTIALSISALLGIFIFIFGKIGEVQRKILLTMLSLGGFSITGLCASILYDKRKFLFLSYSGMIASLFGFLYSLLLIWEIIKRHLNIFFVSVYSSGFEEQKLLFVLIIVSIALAHLCLILLAHKEKSSLNIIIWIAAASTTIISLMLIGSIILEWHIEEPFYRALGILAILDILSTITIPVLNKINLLNKKIKGISINL
jgi:predicted nucleic acid-binding Zn ribbon protein